MGGLVALDRRLTVSADLSRGTTVLINAHGIVRVGPALQIGPAPDPSALSSR
jgi:hypothetical protein